MNILIVKMSAVGDVVHTLPALNAIRKHYPDARIEWLVEEAASDLVKGHQALDRVLVSERKRWIRGLSSSLCLNSVSESFRFVKKLRQTSYDLIFDFQGLLKSGVLVGLARGKRKIGYDKGMEHMEQSYRFLNERVPPVSMDNHALLRSMMLLDYLGIPASDISFNLPVGDRHRDMAYRLLARYGVGQRKPLVAIHPVAKWETKLWSNDKFSRLADKLIERYGAEVIFTGTRADYRTIEHIVSNMKSKAANLAGETALKTLAALHEKIDFLVSPDTGPMHIAAALGTPVIALFGPTAPWRTGPFGNGHQVVQTQIDCSPCFKRTCKTVDCMEKITVEQVLESAKAILENS